MAELRDPAGIVAGDVAEAFFDAEYAVASGRVSLAQAQAEVGAAMRRIVDEYRAREREKGGLDGEHQ